MTFVQPYESMESQASTQIHTRQEEMKRQFKQFAVLVRCRQ